MSDFSSLTSESVKSLGVGAHLVTALPSAVLVLSSVALITSRLYPWAEPVINEQNEPVTPGVDSVVYSLAHAGSAGVVVLTLTILGGAVLLRPFQISLVQVLEGYWRGGKLHQLRVGRHMTRLSVAASRALVTTDEPQVLSADAVTVYSRQLRAKEAMLSRADQTLRRYPDDGALVMPTTLGNVLRMAETSAGERYGLDTNTMFPRVYPFLSARLDGEYREQVNLLDSSSAFTLLFSALTVISSPLVWRVDAWSLLPFVTAVVAMISYRGACAAAANIARQLATAFDLHRFEMLTAMRQRLPRHGREEQEFNGRLSEAVAGSDAALMELRYRHPDQAVGSRIRRARS